MVAFRPFVPGCNEHQPFCRPESGPRVRDRLPEPRPVLLRCAVHEYGTEISGARSIVPGHQDAPEQGVVGFLAEHRLADAIDVERLAWLGLAIYGDLPHRA